MSTRDPGKVHKYMFIRAVTSNPVVFPPNMYGKERAKGRTEGLMLELDLKQKFKGIIGIQG
jgi:hypothetical protein